jgi:Recombination endonuclease VII
VPRPRESDEHKRRVRTKYQRAYRASHPLTAEEKARNAAANKLRQQTPEYKARAAAKYRARREALASHSRPDLCEICGRPPNGMGALHLDHCHTTGTFRGWLCHSCNLSLGAVADDPDLLRKLADYLDRFKRPDGPYRPQPAMKRAQIVTPLPLLDDL